MKKAKRDTSPKREEKKYVGDDVVRIRIRYRADLWNRPMGIMYDEDE